MISLGGTISLCIMAMLIGKRRPGPMTWVDYIIVATIALAQAAVVVYDLFTLELPTI